MKKSIKICHLTTVHPRYDTRIFVKECSSLARNGYDVKLVVADGYGNETKNNVEIYDIGCPSGRLGRMLFSSKKLYKKATLIDADVYHFHDPELLGVGRKLIKIGKLVIYDVHEDVPRQLLTKDYIPAILRKPLAKLIENYENRIAQELSGIITATPHIKNRYLEFNSNSIEVQNFPFLEEFGEHNNSFTSKERSVCYVGAISKVRGILQMVDAMQYVDDITFLLGGKFESHQLRNKVIKSKGWEKVKELGFLSREEVKDTLQKSFAGLVVLEPTINYLDSIPVKMFEYMASGIPVIASDFKYWRELIEDSECAFFVDPQDPKAIAEVITKLADNEKKAIQMGENGRNAVLVKFNWREEEMKLIKFYEILCQRIN